MHSSTKMKFTGERFTPECQREIWYEHMHRYAAITSLVKSKVVLDAACGEGYGSEILSKEASQIIGVDIDDEAINHAKSRYNNSSNLKFIQADVVALPFENNLFDVIVSFETLEHLEAHEALLSEFKRVLKVDGLLIISTPDKAEYSDKTGFNNEYHVKELYKQEFKNLLDNYFSYQKWFGQKLMFSSMLWNLEEKVQKVSTSMVHENGDIAVDDLTYNPMYYVVVASSDPIEQFQFDCHLFTDKEETVYEHYNEMIREYIAVAEKFVALNDKHERWKKHWLMGRLMRWLEKD